MFYDLDGYLPWHIKTPKALVRTVEVHLGLWLATIEIRSQWRFLVALLLVPSGACAYFFWWHKNILTVIAALIVLGWLLYTVLRGKRLEAKSI
jgi:hypothetical protein